MVGGSLTAKETEVNLLNDYVAFHLRGQLVSHIAGEIKSPPV